MSDAGLLVAALLGMMLTAGAILRDTRHRLRILRTTPSNVTQAIRPFPPAA